MDRLEVALAAITFIFCRLLILKYVGHGGSRKGLKSLPGPKGIPFVGNLLDMPASHEWEWAAKQAQTYGKEYISSSIATALMIERR